MDGDYQRTAPSAAAVFEMARAEYNFDPDIYVDENFEVKWDEEYNEAWVKAWIRVNYDNTEVTDGTYD